MIVALNAQQQQQFDALLSQLEEQLDQHFSVHRGTFLTNPAQRYSQAVIYPNDPAVSRQTIRRHLQNALDSIGVSYQRSHEGTGVYLRDNYTIGDLVVYVCCARRGGRMIGFDLVDQ